MAVLGRIVAFLRGDSAEIRIEPPPLYIEVELAVPNSDAEERADPTPAERSTIADLIGATFAIEYVDAAGAFSRRRITLRSIERAYGDLLFHAWCHERQAPRKFYGARMQSVIDLRTGEVHKPPSSFLCQIAPIAGATNDGSAGEPRPRRRELPAAGKIGSNVLVFIARCDGHEHEQETQVINKWASELNSAIAIEDVAWHIERMHPDAGIFRDALNEMRRWSVVERDRFLDAARALVEADAQTHADEAAFLAELRAAITPKRRRAPTAEHNS